MDLKRSTWISLLISCWLPLAGQAQLSSPIAGGVPAGTGPGVHSPNSPFAPLPQRTDVLPWSLLTAVKLRDGPKGPRPRYTPEQQALNDKSQRVQGFMMPLEPGEKQKHFLLTSVPLTCAFCTPGGPESMVEVYSQNPVKYSLEPVVVEGRLMVLADDPYGLYYRIKDGVVVK
ncbi:DUF3299 domain-containing protein [Rhodoferax lithotrophicus]|uniref:DUF3299 domain-containing protein n=1 Tax=Rhodoferax lithotrophicus TaxID=2798804 RepID=UPI001CC3B5DE|nr:DUF3299 domain-containing protein [Rhodoferax sp. MIZ03]